MNTEKPDQLSADHENLPTLLLDLEFSSVADYIPAEVFLETLGYFTPSSRRLKNTLTKKVKIGERVNPDGTTTELYTKIIGTGEYGLPVTSDQDYYRAFQKILDELIDQEGEIPDPIKLPVKKILRYAGKHISKRAVEEVKDWIRINRFTGLQGFIFNAATGEYEEKPFESLFRDYRLRGERLLTQQIAETNYVWLAEWFLTNYRKHNFRPLDYAFHKRLRKPISKSLYPLLETGWYASNGEPYSKRYRDLTQQFLLRKERYISQIKQQLDPAHDELRNEKFLKNWTYHKSANKADCIITYWPGEKFFHDQKAREDRRRLAGQITKRIKPPSTPSQRLCTDNEQRLLDWALDICGDRENEAAYRKVIRDYPQGLIETVIGETKQAKLERRIRTSAGAYFMDTLKRLSDLRARA